MRLIDADKLCTDIMEDKHHRLATAFLRCLMCSIVQEAPTVEICQQLTMMQNAQTITHIDHVDVLNG